MPIGYDSNEHGDKGVEGYMSLEAMIYLADVHDHMKYVLTSIEMFTGIAKKLTNHSFFVTICGATAQSFSTNVGAILTGLNYRQNSP